MRVTKNKIEPEIEKEITQLVDRLVTVDDFTLANDFAKDAYVLFDEEVSKRKVFKRFWQLFKDIKLKYVKFKISSLKENFDLYSRVRNFFKYFVSSNLFYELDKLDSLEALEQFLKMFKPPLQRQKKKEKKIMKEKEKKRKKGKKSKISPNKKSIDKEGLSGDESNLPIDISKFRKQIPNIEKALDSGLLERDDIQKFIRNQAGIEQKELKIGNISNVVKKISKNMTQKELDIFYIARKKELTDKYKRDEIIKSVPVPDNEMSVKSMSNYQEMLKILPGQFALNKEIFNRKLIDKELQVRDYQSRRLKKQALYLLIDISGSMQGEKSTYASGVALSLVRQAINEGSTYFLRFFDSYPKDLYKVINKEKAQELCKILVKQPYSGGGTNITKAIKKAVKDIDNDPKDFEKTEIMVITDGQDNLSLTEESLRGIKLHSTMIGGLGNESLKEYSDTYTEIPVENLEGFI